METAKQKLIFIDLDGTLTLQSTWFLLNQRLGITAQEDHDLFTRYIGSNLGYEGWITELVNLYKSRGFVSRKEIREFAEKIPLRPDAVSTVTALREKGYRVVILSGSVDGILEVLAKSVGADDWRSSSRLVFDENDNLTSIIASGDEAPAKELLAQEYAKANGFALGDAYAIDDGGNGVELFKHTKGIVLGSNEELLPLAWEQVETLSEIPPLL